MTPSLINLADLIIRIFAPEAGIGAYNDWRIVATTTLATWTLFAIGAALVIAVVISGRTLRRVPLRRAIILLLLRTSAAIWVMGLILRPAIELRAVSRVRSRVALLVDASRSMGLATPDGTRAELVEKHLADNQDRLTELAQRAVIEPAVFGERVHAMERLPDKLPTEEARTDIARALN